LLGFGEGSRGGALKLSGGEQRRNVRVDPKELDGVTH
jgi:hypothetical protein